MNVYNHILSEIIKQIHYQQKQYITLPELQNLTSRTYLSVYKAVKKLRDLEILVPYEDNIKSKHYVKTKATKYQLNPKISKDAIEWLFVFTSNSIYER